MYDYRTEWLRQVNKHESVAWILRTPERRDTHKRFKRLLREATERKDRNYAAGSRSVQRYAA